MVSGLRMWTHMPDLGVGAQVLDGNSLQKTVRHDCAPSLVWIRLSLMRPAFLIAYGQARSGHTEF